MVNGKLMNYFLKQAVVQTGDVNVRREDLHVQISADVKKFSRMLIHPLAKQGQTKNEESYELYIFNIQPLRIKYMICFVILKSISPIQHHNETSSLTSISKFSIICIATISINFKRKTKGYLITKINLRHAKHI